MKGKKVVITGGAGSIGSELVKKVLSEGAEEVAILDIDEIRMFHLSKIFNDKRLKFYVTDIRDLHSVDRALSQMDRVDVIFHTAAMKHVVVCEENPLEATLTNVIGTQNIVDIAVKNNVNSSILISTDKAADPINVLGATKLVAEKIFLAAAKKYSNQKFSVVRFGNVANSRGSVIPLLTDSLLHKKEVTITNRHVTRFIMRIEEAVDLILKSLECSIGGEIFILKMPSFELGTLADILVNCVAPQVGIPAKEITIKTTDLVRGEKLHERLFAEDEVKDIADLNEYYAIIDTSAFPNHKKYLSYRSISNIISSENAPRISHSKLKEIVLDYLKTLLGEARLL